ncbi:MAG: Asp-tRNA(Asn)/Glu-tRNA(Gln) amidotransferase subunit GatC [Melioribacteraceae bacterium]
MAVNKKDVEHIASLAKLKFDEDELSSITDDLNNILGYVEKLNELNTDNIEPLYYPIEYENVLRDDVEIKSIPTEKGLENAPDRTDEHFRVPKVINKEI